MTAASEPETEPEPETETEPEPGIEPSFKQRAVDSVVNGYRKLRPMERVVNGYRKLRRTNTGDETEGNDIRE